MGIPMNYKHSAMAYDPNASGNQINGSSSLIEVPPSIDELEPHSPLKLNNDDSNDSTNNIMVDKTKRTTSPQLHYDPYSKLHKNKHLSMTIHKKKKQIHKKKKDKKRTLRHLDQPQKRSHPKASKKGPKHKRPRLRKSSSFGRDESSYDLDEIGDFQPHQPTESSKKIQVVRVTKPIPHPSMFERTAPSNKPLHHYNYNKRGSPWNSGSKSKSKMNTASLSRSGSAHSLRAVMRHEYDEKKNEQKISDLQLSLYNQSPVSITPKKPEMNGLNAMNAMNGVNGFNLNGNGINSRDRRHSPFLQSLNVPKSLIHGPRSPGRSSTASPQLTHNGINGLNGGELMMGMEPIDARVSFNSLDLGQLQLSRQRSNASNCHSSTVSTDYRYGYEGQADYHLNTDRVDYDITYCLNVLRSMNGARDQYSSRCLSMNKLNEMQQIIDALKGKIVDDGDAGDDGDHGDDDNVNLNNDASMNSVQGPSLMDIQSTDQTNSTCGTYRSLTSFDGLESRHVSLNTNTTEEHEDEDEMSEDGDHDEDGSLRAGVEFLIDPPLSTKGSGEFTGD